MSVREQSCAQAEKSRLSSRREAARHAEFTPLHNCRKSTCLWDGVAWRGVFGIWGQGGWGKVVWLHPLINPQLHKNQRQDIRAAPECLFRKGQRVVLHFRGRTKWFEG